MLIALASDIGISEPPSSIALWVQILSTSIFLDELGSTESKVSIKKLFKRLYIGSEVLEWPFQKTSSLFFEIYLKGTTK